MNYGQFFNMIPEASLIAALIVVFIADFILHKNEKRHQALVLLTTALMAAQAMVCMMTMEPSSAFSGMYVTTASTGMMKAILTMGTIIVVIMSKPWVETTKYAGEYYMLILSTLLGMYMMMSSGHFLLFFLGLEMASVPMACLVAMDKWKRHSAEAGAKFILTATFSSGVMLYGISFLYGALGTLYFNDMVPRLSNAMDISSRLPMLIIGFVFFFSGLGFKISLVPFHFWTADTYQGAPTPVTAYLSVISKGAAAFTLAVILMKVFAPMLQYWQYLLYIVIVLSITIANLFAIRQGELKRFMAFSSISQAGYIMLAVVGNSAMGMTALMYYTLIYIVANMAVFTVINIVEQKNGGTTEMASYNGFYATNPKLAFLMTVALFSLAGIPPFAGMFSKFFVFMAAAEQGSYWAYVVLFVALVNTVVSLYYYLLIVKAMFINKADHPLPTFKSDCYTRLALAICTVGIIMFGVCPYIFNWIESLSINSF